MYLLVLMHLIIQGYIPVSYKWHTQQQDIIILHPFLETNLIMNLERDEEGNAQYAQVGLDQESFFKINSYLKTLTYLLWNTHKGYEFSRALLLITESEYSELKGIHKDHQVQTLKWTAHMEVQNWMQDFISHLIKPVSQQWSS